MGPELALALGITGLLVPAAVTVWQAAARASSRWEEALRLVAAGGLLLFAFFAVPWAFLSYYVRFVPLVGFTLAAARQLSRMRRLPGRAPHDLRRRIGRALTALTAVSALSLDLLLLRGSAYSGDPVALHFPLKGGAYYVLQGGDSPITNPFHRSDPAGRYALDIVKLNALGNRARRLLPMILEDYEIFGQTIYSPCTGEILRVQDGRADNQPPQADLEEPAGNHVLLQCEGVTLLLAHLMNGSVIPQPGERVKQGQPIGRVGNSGNTSEPHLHLQAIKPGGGSVASGGEAVPMLLDGRFLSMNSVIVR